MLSKKLCLGVRNPRYKSKSSVAQKKTHGHGYHLDFELGDRSQDRLRISYPLALALGVGETTRARCIVTLGIIMCEGVGE